MPVSTTYPGVYIEEVPSGAHTITGVSTSVTAFVGRTASGPLNAAVPLTSFAGFEQDFGGLAADSPLSYCVAHFFQNGGAQAWVVRVATSPGCAPADLIGSEAARTGIYALEGIDPFNLLVMPDTAAGSGMLDVLAEAVAYCTRRRAFMIIDVPETVQTFAQARDWMSNDAAPLRRRDAALYFPRLRLPDPLINNAVRNFPAAGAVAGLYAYTDAGRGVWKAPTGPLVGPTDLSCPLTDVENGVLNSLALNCVRIFPIAGIVTWGARTARGATPPGDGYMYVPVRRLALFIEESISRGTQWITFEPTGEPPWSQIRHAVGNFLHRLFQSGAFQGSRSEDAYFARCDSTTTTQQDIDDGRVNIVVGFAPLKPAEFVIITIRQMVGCTGGT
jgi:phage tail sheath protein FI